MPDRQTLEERDASRRPRGRRRDAVIVLVIAIGVLLLLMTSGALGWLEGLTASAIIVMASGAYFLAMDPPETRAPVDDAAPTLRADNDNRRSETELLEAVLATMSVPVIAVDPRGKILASSKTAASVFRVRSTKGTPVSALTRRPDLLSAIDEARTASGPSQLEFTPALGDARRFKVQLSRLALGGQTLVFIEFDDLTSVRRAERARADFLANASHELRTPLASLLGYLETMLGPASADKDRWDRFLEIMHGQAERMNRLIDDLMSLSRIELSETTRPDRATDLALTVREAIEAQRVSSERQKVRVQYTGPEEGLFVLGDRDQLFQVVQNLIDNALKYAGKGARIDVSAGVSADPTVARNASGRRWPGAERLNIVAPDDGFDVPHAWVRVSDNGPGIPSASLPRLGERFYRVDESRSRKVPGTGLGLAIVKHILMRHRAGMIVESYQGSGAAFGFWLREAPADALGLDRAAE